MEYTLTCQNESVQDTQFFVYQRLKNTPNAVSLVWLCQICAQDVSTFFQWEDTSYFIWGYAQSLVQGDRLFTAQSVPVQEGKSVKLSMREDESFSFAPIASKTDEPTIMTDHTVPAETVAVGQGMKADCMCGTGTLAVCMGPNSNFFFDSEVEYYLGHHPARNLKLGDVLDLNRVTSVPLVFSSGRSHLIATLDETNKLIITRPIVNYNSI